jgi:hypothetical protein
MTSRTYKSFAAEKPNGEIGIFAEEEEIADQPNGQLFLKL